MELINTTGRYIIVSGERGNVKNILAPTDTIARVTGEAEHLDAGDAPVQRYRRAEVQGLPAPRDGVYYVVTNKVACCTSRKDVVIPEFGEGGLVNGRYVGVRRFVAINGSSDPAPPGEEHTVVTQP